MIQFGENIKLTFLGTGSFFSGYDINHTNLLLTGSSGKNLLLDCSSRMPLMLEKLKIDPSTIDAVYISHLHDDHVGGLEWLAFYKYFSTQVRPDLICHNDIMKKIWTNRLSCAVGVLRGQITTLDTFFSLISGGNDDASFKFDGIIDCILAPVIHVENDESSVYSFGLEIKFYGQTIYWTSDIGEVEGKVGDNLVNSQTMILMKNHKRYMNADLIIHDCEVGGSYPSKVHTHYDHLKRLPEEIKKKMLLCHYRSRKGLPNAKKDGFKGFAKPGQVIEYKNGKLRC